MAGDIGGMALQHHYRLPLALDLLIEFRSGEVAVSVSQSGIFGYCFPTVPILFNVINCCIIDMQNTLATDCTRRVIFKEFLL